MVEMRVEYKGDLRTEIVHGPSGQSFETDAPRDNQGLGERFSPTDLFAASLGSCVLTIMGIAARKRKLVIDDAKVRVEKYMKDAPRRVDKIVLDFTMPASLSQADRAIMQRISEECPVRLSINPSIQVETRFRYV